MHGQGKCGLNNLPELKKKKAARRNLHFHRRHSLVAFLFARHPFRHKARNIRTRNSPPSCACFRFGKSQAGPKLFKRYKFINM